MKRAYLYACAAAAVLTLAPSIAAADTPEILLCTGGETGVYYQAGQMIADKAGRRIKVKIVETGGTKDNMERVIDLGIDHADQCHAMIGQPDGPAYLHRTAPAKANKLRQVGTLHREYFQMVCNKAAKVDDLGDMEGSSNYTVAVGAPGSGAWLIWQNIIAEDEKYGAILTSNEEGSLALSAVDSGTAATCLVRTAGLGDGVIARADSAYGDTMVLAGAYDDKDFNDALGIDGKPLYTYDYPIPAGTYPVSFQKPGFFSGSAKVNTISWNAQVFVNKDKFDNKTLDAFITAVADASQQIKAKWGK